MAALVSFWMHPDAVYLSPAPLYHTAPSVWSMQTQAGGITTVVMEKFDAEGCLDAIAKHRVTHGQFVPVMFTRMLKLPEDVRKSYDVSSLERVMHAAAPCPVEIKKQMIDWWGPIVDEYYASSEAHGSTLITAEEWLTHPGSVGRPLTGVLHIVGEDGEELPPGQAGRSTSRAVTTSSTSTIRRRLRRHAIRRAGRPWATSDISTTRVTCT